MNRYALMNKVLYGRHRSKMVGVIQTSNDGEEFLVRIVRQESYDGATVMDENEAQAHKDTSEHWSGSAPDDAEDLSSMTKKELEAVAEKLGIEIPPKSKKSSILALLQGVE
jgi:hypothetical protein